MERERRTGTGDPIHRNCASPYLLDNRDIARELPLQIDGLPHDGHKPQAPRRYEIVEPSLPILRIAAKVFASSYQSSRTTSPLTE